MQLPIEFIEAQARCTFTDTRSRHTDPQTSRDAAKHATSTKAQQERIAIRESLVEMGPMTAREIAATTRLDYIEVQRRISETAGIERTQDRRDGCAVWRAIA